MEFDIIHQKEIKEITQTTKSDKLKGRTGKNNLESQMSD